MSVTQAFGHAQILEYKGDVSGGEGGIRTPGTGLGPYDGLANRCFRPLSHLSVFIAADFSALGSMSPHYTAIFTFLGTTLKRSPVIGLQKT